MSLTVANIEQAAAETLRARAQVPQARALLVGLSGIDGSGKGYVAQALIARLREREQNAVGINVDGWLNLPHRRFSQMQPAAHFYEHALRFEEMFAQLVLPLKAERACDIVAGFAEETAAHYRPHRYKFADVDIIVLEGIYLFKRAYRAHFDLSFWLDCTFETALERALARGQEGLPPAETVRAYQTIYFPAQEIHSHKDEPRRAADFILANDPRLAAAGAADGAISA